MNTESRSRLPILQGHGLTHAYGKGAARSVILNNISVQFWPGELTLIMGASGSGKSTLLAVLGGLLRPDQGQVWLAETAIWTMTSAVLEKLRFQRYAYIFQGFNLFPALTALEQVALPLYLGGTPKKQSTHRAKTALVEVGLSEHIHLRPVEMSGGEKQRVAIARALVMQPAVLFADEPTSALDSANSDVAISLLHRIARIHDTCVIAVTHDPRLMPHAERILSIGDGAIQPAQPATKGFPE